MASLEIEESTDYDAIRSILKAPGIYENIADSDEPFTIPRDVTYLVGHVESVPMALFVLHGDADSMECHVQVLPSYRKAYANEFGQRVVEMAKGYTRTLVAEIPKRYENVHRFALSQGFEVTSESEDTRYYKHGLY